MYKQSKNPLVEEILKKHEGRSKDLSTLSVVKVGDKRFCAWCVETQLHNRNQKYCSTECSNSAMASFYPQKEEGLNVLLIRQDWRCANCLYDYVPLAQQIANEMDSYLGINEDAPFKEKFSWPLMKRLKGRTPKERKPEVDHIVPIYKGGQSLGLSNHQCLCYTCHKEKSKLDNSGKRIKKILVISSKRRYNISMEKKITAKDKKDYEKWLLETKEDAPPVSLDEFVKSKKFSKSWDKAFGKKPKKGYKFLDISIEIIDNNRFKGLDIGWSASGVGFGHVCIAWGLDEDTKKNFPKQYGFHTDTECMSEEFIKALMKAAAPKIAELIMNNERK